jgi:signal transduction histidine kinase
VFFIVLIVMEYRRRQVRHITEKLELEHQYRNEVLQTQMEVQEQSFKYVSEELHDNIAQTLSLVKLKLYKTVGKTNDEALKAAIGSSTELLGNTLNDLRNLSHVLNGGLVSRLSLQDSIEKELSYIHGIKGLQCNLHMTGDSYDLSDEKKLLIFRIVQEAINNALKHGKATEINITLAYQRDILKVQIADNGTGFDSQKANDYKGLGLHNMHVRAKMLGHIDIQSQENKGTTITLTVNTNE